MIRDLSKRDRKGQALYVGARPRNGRWTQQQGFTLIELMITLAISAILLSVAAPAYQSFIGSTALTTATNDLVAALNMARSEALKRDGAVTLRGGDADTASDDFADGYCIVPGRTPLAVTVRFDFSRGGFRYHDGCFRRTQTM